MPRKLPCRACKKRQKGCIWKRNSTACLLCKKLNVECVPSQQDSSSDDNDVLPREYIPKALEYWNYQIEQLEAELQQTERNLIRCRDQQQQQKVRKWKLSIDNGRLKLHTAIRSYEELIMFSQASLRYLSPFQGIFNISTLRFENRALMTVMHAIYRVFSQAVSDQAFKGHLLYSPKSIPFIPDMRGFIDMLIHLHLQYSNVRLPFLHAPTFLEHYNNLTDPFSCPLTLAICVNTVCTCRKVQQMYSATERLQLTEYFYEKCKDILDETFDDPTRKLETIFTITFLSLFVTLVLLRPAESRRLATIAYLLCKDLEPTYSGNSESTVESILFQRHFFYIQRMVKVTERMLNGSFSFPLSPEPLFLEKMPDECETACAFIDMYNTMFDFFKSPCMKKVITFADNPVRNISLETIFETDRLTQEWWNSLPSNLRLCDDYCSTEAEKAVNQSQPFTSLVMFAFVHYIILRIHGCMINPTLSSEELVHGSNDILQMLSNKAISKVLRSCDLLLNALLEMITGYEIDIPPITFEFMSRAIHALVTVLSCPNTEIPSSIQHKFFACAQAFGEQLPSDNKIPPSLSPLKAYMEKQEQGDLQVYFNYPMPSIALAADMFRMFCTDLQSCLARNQMGPSSTYKTSFVNAALCADFPVQNKISNKSL